MSDMCHLANIEAATVLQEDRKVSPATWIGASAGGAAPQELDCVIANRQG